MCEPAHILNPKARRFVENLPPLEVGVVDVSEGELSVRGGPQPPEAAPRLHEQGQLDEGHAQGRVEGRGKGLGGIDISRSERRNNNQGQLTSCDIRSCEPS